MFRFLIDNDSLWFSCGLYEIASCLLLGPLYRFFFWISVKTVKVKIIKTFNTEESFGEPHHNENLYNNRECNVPYINNLEGFQINQFSEAGGTVGVLDYLA